MNEDLRSGEVKWGAEFGDGFDMEKGCFGVMGCADVADREYFYFEDLV